MAGELRSTTQPGRDGALTVFRRALIAAADSDRLRRVATGFGPARRVARRFVAGETIDEALAATSALHEDGLRVTLDHLGEAVTDAGVAEAAAAVYVDLLDRVATSGGATSLSVKPTQVGLGVDRDLARDLLARIAARAADAGTHVTLDMEGSAVTQATLDLVRDLRARGHDNVGCAVQSYLHRTRDDVRELTDEGVSVRLCKGAYAEPASIAYQDRAAVAASFADCAAIVLDGATYGRFATHDHRLIAWIRAAARRRGIEPDRFEFQALYGVRAPLQRGLREAGHDVRVYVPFGDQWYPYFVRRIAERPANLAFFLRALVARR